MGARSGLVRGLSPSHPPWGWGLRLLGRQGLHWSAMEPLLRPLLLLGGKKGSSATVSIASHQ